MPGARPNGTIYKVAMEQTYAGLVPIVTIFWFRQMGGLQDEVALGEDFNNNLRASWAGCNNQHTTWVQTTISTFTIETSTVPADYVTNAHLPQGGGLADWPGAPYLTPAMLAQHAILRTPFSGRSSRGRLYMGPSILMAPSPTQQADGFFWHSSRVAGFQVFLDAVLDRYNVDAVGASWEWGVWSRKNGGNVGPGGASTNKPPFHAAGFTAITSATAYAGIRTQRRREAPRGT